MLPAADHSASPAGSGGEAGAVPGGTAEARGSQRDTSLPPVDDGDSAEDDQLGPTHVNTTKASHLVKVGSVRSPHIFFNSEHPIITPEIPPFRAGHRQLKAGETRKYTGRSQAPHSIWSTHHIPGGGDAARARYFSFFRASPGAQG